MLLVILLQPQSRRRKHERHNPMSNDNFDLGAFNKVPLTVISTDAAGNLVSGATPVLTSSDETVITIQDDGAGNKVAVRVASTPGTATITATVTNADGTVVSGSLSLTLGAVGGAGTPPAGGVANVQIVPGTPS
jgi:hypothetical protein